MAIYLAADEPLPLLDDHAGAVLYTTALRDENDRAVRGHFTKPYVVYAGSYEGCGCGFFKLEHAEYREPEDVEACRKSLSTLAEYLQDALVRCGSVELFTCWEGDQPQPELTAALPHPPKSWLGF